MLCENCTAKIPTLTTRQRKVNDELHAVGLTYHEWVPWTWIEKILTDHGFIFDGPFTTTGVNRVHQTVGEGKWLTCSWHRMESGRYEVVAYVN